MMDVAWRTRALHDAAHCGDACAVWRQGARTLLALADGLGHGREAERAALAALDWLQGQPDSDPAMLMAGCDRALRHTRGVALGLVVLDREARCWRYAGVGNIRALLHRRCGETPRLANDNGIVGGGYVGLNVTALPLHSGDRLVLASDGLDERLNPESPAGLSAEGLAGALLDDWGHGRDDAAVLVCEWRDGQD